MNDYISCATEYARGRWGDKVRSVTFTHIDFMRRPVCRVEVDGELARFVTVQIDCNGTMLCSDGYVSFAVQG